LNKVRLLLIVGVLLGAPVASAQTPYYGADPAAAPPAVPAQVPPQGELRPSGRVPLTTQPQPSAPVYAASPGQPYTQPPAQPYTQPPGQPAYTPPGAQPAYTQAPAAQAGFNPPGLLQPNTPAAKPSPWLMLNQARALLQQAQPQQALNLATEFVRLKPLEPEGYFWQGVALDNLGRTQPALRSYEIGIQQTLKAGMDSAELRMNAGNALLKLGRLDDAIVQYRRAVEIDPGLALAHLNLGRALVEKGDVEGALECFQRCEDLHFKPYQLSYYRAKAFVRAGRIADAKAQVVTALSKLDKTSTVSARLQQEFSSVLAGP
jgi:tetratricopeptide (TPR) repeat protein